MPSEYKNVYVFRGQEPGNVSFLTGKVHANETPAGKAVEAKLDALLSRNTIREGTVYVALVNQATEERGMGGVDFNRVCRPDKELTEEQLRSPAYARFKELEPFLLEADALYDVHATKNRLGRPFLIAKHSRRALKIARLMPFEHVVDGFDEVHAGSIDGFMNKHGKIGLSGECGFIDDPETLKRANESIDAFLVARGHTDGESTRHDQKKIVIVDLYRPKTGMTFPDGARQDFEPLPVGTRLGMDGDKPIITTRQGQMPLFMKGVALTPTEGVLVVKERQRFPKFRRKVRLGE